MASEIKKFYEFGRFRFDIERLRLECEGEPIPLPRKSLETLKVLLEEKGEVVTREELLEKIWAESFVEDANLTVAVSGLRKALAVHDDETLIETVPRRGYRFVGDAQEKSEDPDWPIIVEHHAVEQLTIEKSRTRVISSVLLLAAVTVVVAAGWFMLGQWRSNAGAVSLERDPAASEAFQKGDALLQKRQMCESIPHFRDAVAKDENFARAYSSLAAALAMCEFTDETDHVIARALALDPNLPEANATDGFIKMFRHLDWNGAEAALRRAVALDPNSAKAHHWLGVCLSIRGHFREAEGELARAIAIEPNLPLYHADLCEIRYFQPYPDRAVTECQKALEIDPDFAFAPRYLRDIYLLLGDQQKAWEYEVQDMLIEKKSPGSIEIDESAFRTGGFKAVYQNRVRYLLDQMTNGSVNQTNRANYSVFLARHYAYLSDRENTLYWLEQAVDGEKGTYPFAIAYLAVEPRYAFLRGDPRFHAILKKLDLTL